MSEPVTPIVSTEFVLDRNVLYLYIHVVSILGGSAVQLVPG
ncbi:MAG: hypothetical protein QFX34_04950 [Candidatus Verstraetearchaeota archaeon]|nr:hypothetical protein [Candidatus Verstraetearchaeota archaeon]